ncbi:MAG TPA: N-acetylmuramoyl-L-alanine amidase [bacterium]|nr:N-acetylmuramoyl-L-alanine amidase [bacterium]
MKLLSAAATIAVILALWSNPGSAENGFPQVTVNDRVVAFSAPLALQHGAVMAPLAPLAASFGATMVWDRDAHTATVTSAAGLAVRLSIGEAEALVGAERVELPTAPVLKGDVVVVPAAAVLRAMGAYVKEGEGRVEALSQTTGVTWGRHDGVLTFVIATSGPVGADAHLLDAPDRLAVDISHSADLIEKPVLAVGDADVVRVRHGQFQVRPFVTRVVFDLTRRVPYRIAVAPGAVTVTIGDAIPAARTPPAEGALPPEPELDSQPAPAGVEAETHPERDDRSAPAVSPDVAIRDVPVEHPTAVPAEPLAPPPLPPFADAPGAFHLQAVTYDIQSGTGHLTIIASQPAVYQVKQFVYPSRLAIDLPGAVFMPRRQDLEVGSSTIRNVVVEQLHTAPNLARIMINLRRQSDYSASTTDEGRRIDLVFGDGARAAPPGPAVIIDPGHGGADSGAVGPTGLRESTVTLAISRMVQQRLARQGIRVVLTRTDDSTVALEDRPDVAQRAGGVVFVSIHANASQSPLKEGTETYYGTADSHALAMMIQSEVVQALGEPDRGIRTADFYVIVKTPMPSVLVETAFISNPVEERLLRRPAVQTRIAEAIARAILRFLASRSASLVP